jgi:hypothetical protein
LFAESRELEGEIKTQLGGLAYEWGWLFFANEGFKVHPPCFWVFCMVGWGDW